MILTCPSCATSYFTPDDVIGSSGRRVRCQSCAHTWHASLDEPLELTLAPGAGGPQPVRPEPEPTTRVEAESLAETPAPELPRAFRARAEQQRRIRRAAAHGAVWAGLASVFIGLIAAGWLFRVEVVEMYPRAAAAYAMIGSPVNPTGLEFEAVGAKASPLAPDRVLVSGALRNVRDREVVAPAVRLALLDAQGAEIGHAIVRIDAAPVLPGGVQGFAALIADPGARAAGVGVDFVIPPKPSKRTRPVEAAAAASPPAPIRPLPVADHGALRPALSPMSDLPINAEPIDARPIADGTAPHGAGAAVHGAAVQGALSAEALDSDHAEAVSASDHG